MFKNLLLIVGVVSLCSGQVFRFDYEYVPKADGWMKFHIVPSTWNVARLRCHAEGGVLASPLTTELKNALISFVQKKRGKTTTFFTGVHAIFSQGDYTSVEGVPLSRLPITWEDDEPDNFQNSESCLAMAADSRGSMSDVRCSDVLPYVCYKKFQQLNMMECGTTDPEYVLEPRTGSCYKFHRNPRVWHQAHMTCLAEGGHLVILNSEEEAAIIRQLAERHPANTGDITSSVGVGYHDWGDHGTFMTIHGETLDAAGFDRWSEGRPDNATLWRTGDVGEFCGGMFRGNNLLNDVWCGVPVEFVCEMTPNNHS